MNARLADELELLRRVYPDIEFRDVDHGWFMIPVYSPPPPWRPEPVRVAFQLRAGYPGSSPYSFFVSPPLRTADEGAKPKQNYQEPAPTPFDGDWSRFSWDADGSWSPGPTAAAGTNLLDFVRSFDERLREGP